MENSNFKNFSLSKEILKTLEKLGYEKPSQVQEEVIPFILENKDVIVKAQTGSGKTAAFGIPLCEKIEIENKDPQALILTPTRELAVQVKEEIFNIGRFKKIRAAAIFGKQPMSIQKRELQQRVHIVVGTPGRTLDHMERGTLKLSDIKYLIIDEADEMLNMGFIDEVSKIIDKMPKKRVTMLFSATINDEIKKLCTKYMINPENIEISPENLTTEKIKQFYLEVDYNNKFELLNKIIYAEVPDTSIIFCNTKDAVENLFTDMKNKGFSCGMLHGGMQQVDRLKAINDFKMGKFTFLIATDVAARGIHIDNITHVINYDLPFEKESYVHRIGRTGRAGTEGIAITFMSPKQQRFLSDIEEYVGESIDKKDEPSEEEIQAGKELLKNKSKVITAPKKDKTYQLNKEITKIYINAGKKKKIRPGDIVGAISSISGITAENIGIIDVQDNVSYVDILGGKGTLVLKELQQKTIKGKKLKVQRALK